MSKSDTTNKEDRPGDSIVHAVQTEEARLGAMLRQSREEGVRRVEDARKNAATNIEQAKIVIQKEVEIERSEVLNREVLDAEALLRRREEEEKKIVERARKRHSTAVLHIIEAVTGRATL